MIEAAKKFYARHQRWIPIAAFALGFGFDALVLKRIDEWSVIIQQAAYLLVVAALLYVELIEAANPITPPALLHKPWQYRELVFHFLLGTLLNSFAIFYFKSTSGISSYSFILLLVCILIFNEFVRFGKAHTQVHVIFVSLCLISYLASMAPIFMGYVGDTPFLLAVLVALLVFYGYFKLVSRKLPGVALRTQLVYPFAATQLVFFLLYFAHAIPPVPLSVTYMGIYHNIQKQPDGYLLTHYRDPWKFWQHGDQDFLARPGESVFCFAQVFSPARFQDNLQVRWLYKDRRGWQSSDAIPLPIVGGREEGYRAITRKDNFQPGEWRVQIETKDSREIGRIDFTIVADESVEERVPQVELK